MQFILIEMGYAWHRKQNRGNNLPADYKILPNLEGKSIPLIQSVIHNLVRFGTSKFMFKLQRTIIIL